MSRPRNVLFLAGDQWRADSLGCMGHPLVQTPRLDRLAGEGTLFRRHFANASPCGPSRTCMLTGSYLMTNRAVRNGTPVDRRFTNLALEARKAGLFASLFGYTDTGEDPRGKGPADPELQQYEGVLPGFEAGCRVDESLRTWRAHLLAKGYENVPDGYHEMFEPSDGRMGGPSRFRQEDSLTAFLADQVIDCMRVNRDRGWLIHVTFWHPHPPLRASEPWNSLYDPADTAPATCSADPDLHPFHAHCLKGGANLREYLGSGAAGRDLDAEIIARIRASYYGLISETDHHIGRLLDTLEETGQAEDTLIVSTVDHGEMLGDHGLLGKATLFDPAYHIPLIVRAPEQQSGRQVDAMTESIDLMPSILDWLGMPIPAQCDGRSLLPFLAGETPSDWRQAVFWEHDFRDVVTREAETALGLDSRDCNLACLRGERFKYVHFAGQAPLLFDLEADPFETRNLAEDAAYLEVRLEMAEAMLRHRQRHAEQSLTGLAITAAGLKGDLEAAGLGQLL